MLVRKLVGRICGVFESFKSIKFFLGSFLVTTDNEVLVTTDNEILVVGK
jgi:hypothetical protein